MEKTDFEQCLAKAEEQLTLLKAAQENAEREKQPRKLGEDIPEKRPPQAVKLYGSNDGKVASES
jgi:hypothetical protein